MNYFCQYLRGLILQGCILFFLHFSLAFTFAFSLTVPTADLLFTLGQSLKTLQEFDLPGQKVCLDTAISTFYHITVTLSPGHNSLSTQHPQPLVHMFTNLMRERLNTFNFVYYSMLYTVESGLAHVSVTKMVLRLLQATLLSNIALCIKYKIVKPTVL